MVVLCQKWADAFMKANPGVQVQVTGGGSGTGIAALLNGTTDLAAASRQIKPKEVATAVLSHGSKPQETATALDGIGVYVNETNPIEALTMDQLHDIFTGKITNWNKVGGPDLEITVYSRENNSGTYAFFKETVLEDKDYTQRAQTMAGTAALISAVAEDKRGIGYGGVGYAKGVRIVPLKRTDDGEPAEPTEAKVASGDYPISRALYLYANPKSLTPEANAFLAFTTSPDGQRIVKEVGYYPLNAAAVAEAAPDSKPAASATNPQPAAAAPVAMPEGASNILSVHLDLVKREKALIEREIAIARRESEVAMREMRAAEREAAAAKREESVAAAEESLAKREAAVAAALGLTAQN